MRVYVREVYSRTDETKNPCFTRSFISFLLLPSFLTTGNANFGVTSDNRLVLGQLTQHDVHHLGFSQLLSGFGWLLYNSYVLSNADCLSLSLSLL